MKKIYAHIEYCCEIGEVDETKDVTIQAHSPQACSGCSEAESALKGE